MGEIESRQSRVWLQAGGVRRFFYSHVHGAVLVRGGVIVAKRKQRPHFSTGSISDGACSNLYSTCTTLLPCGMKTVFSSSTPSNSKVHVGKGSIRKPVSRR